MTLFSVIVPVYNVAPWLRECLDSVLRQTFSDWECVCVDDGSTDGSGAILDEFAARDPRFHPLHQRNMGVAEARNAALGKATGSWIVFLDGDDILATDSLALIHGEIQLFPDIKLFRVGLQRFAESEQPVFPRDRRPDWSLSDISKTLSLQDAYHNFCQFAYRRDLVFDRRFLDYRRGEDRVFLLSSLLSEQAIVFTQAVCYAYRTRTGSSMNSAPSLDVLRDEMEHRLDIIRMIDESDKFVSYARSIWLEGYFVSDLPRILRRRKTERRVLAKEWLKRLKELRKAKGLSACGKTVAWSIPSIRPPALALFLCVCLDSARRRLARLFNKQIWIHP